MKRMRSAGRTEDRRRRAGFSLIEVAVALLVAGTGLIAAFGLFPAALRQSAESRADLMESSFASSLLESIAGNVRQIDDPDEWNDPDRWWAKAMGDTSGSKVFKFTPKTATPAQFREAMENGVSGADGKVGDFSLSTAQVAKSYRAKSYQTRGRIRYYGFEQDDTDYNPNRPLDCLQEPPQFLVRVLAVERDANGYQNGRLPTRYVVTVVSSTVPAPEQYIQNAWYSREYAFIHRP